jgi:2-polyprenyl-3-methyl-5-hydroxy-6-metoxy-1,4-benzoquinol methylase
MSGSVYEEHAQFYVDFVDRGFANSPGYFETLLATIVSCIGGGLNGSKVCDLCCGEGYAGRHLLRSGAAEVVGIDLSPALVAEARRRADSPALSYRTDDAQELRSVADDEFDVVVSQLAMMDVEDHRKTFGAVRRVLRPGGVFVFSLLHPCFEGRPFHVSDVPPPVLRDEQEQPIAVTVRRYATEGHFSTGGTGVRGHVGSFHRRLSTYINDLLATGFRLTHLEEPVLAETGLYSEIPIHLVVAATAE